MLRRGQAEYLESRLFRGDGKFQMRTLAEIQASEQARADEKTARAWRAVGGNRPR